MSDEKMMVFKTNNDFRAFCREQGMCSTKCPFYKDYTSCEFRAGQSCPNDKIRRALNILYQYKTSHLIEAGSLINYVIEILEGKRE
jgi:hypothetical protein